MILGGGGNSYRAAEAAIGKFEIENQTVKANRQRTNYRFQTMGRSRLLHEFSRPSLLLHSHSWSLLEITRPWKPSPALFNMHTCENWPRASAHHLSVFHPKCSHTHATSLIPGIVILDAWTGPRQISRGSETLSLGAVRRGGARRVNTRADQFLSAVLN